MEAATTPLESQRIRAERDHSEPGTPLIGAVLYVGRRVRPAGFFFTHEPILPSSGSTLPTPLHNPSDNGRPCSAVVVVFGAGRRVRWGSACAGFRRAPGTGQQKPDLECVENGSGTGYE